MSHLLGMGLLACLAWGLPYVEMGTVAISFPEGQCNEIAADNLSFSHLASKVETLPLLFSPQLQCLGPGSSTCVHMGITLGVFPVSTE